MRDKTLTKCLDPLPWIRLQAAEAAGQDDDNDAVSNIAAEILDRRSITSTHKPQPQQSDPLMGSPVVVTYRATPDRFAWDRMQAALDKASIKNGSLVFQPKRSRLFSSYESLQRHGRDGELCWGECYWIEPKRLRVLVVVHLARELWGQEITIKNFGLFLKIGTAPDFKPQNWLGVAMSCDGRIIFPLLAIVGSSEDLYFSAAADKLQLY